MDALQPLSDVPVDVLRRLCHEHGVELLRGGGRCGALLADLCGAYRREVFILDSVVRKGLFASRVPDDMPLDLAVCHLAQIIGEQLRFDTDAAKWAASAWASVRGLTPKEPTGARAASSRSLPSEGGVHTAQPKVALHQMVAGTVRAFGKDLGDIRCLENLHRVLLEPVERISSTTTQGEPLATVLVPSFAGVSRGLVLTEHAVHFVNLNGGREACVLDWTFHELQTKRLLKPRPGAISLGEPSHAVDLVGTGLQSKTLIMFLAVLREVIAPFSDPEQPRTSRKTSALQRRRAKL